MARVCRGIFSSKLGFQAHRITCFTCANSLKTNKNRLFSTSTTLKEKLTQSYSHGIANKPFIGDTIGQRIDKIASKFPDREAYIFCEDGKRATFAEFKEEVDQLAASFFALGLKKGDRVGMWGPNMREWVLTQFATGKAGLILVNINPAYKVSEVEYALKKVGCKALVMSDVHKTQDYYQIMTQIAHELPGASPGELYSSRLAAQGHGEVWSIDNGSSEPRLVDNVVYCHSNHLMLSGALVATQGREPGGGSRLPDLKTVIVASKSSKHFSGTLRFADLEVLADTSDKQLLKDIQEEIDCDDPINIQFTSGTTGFPKGVTLTHHGILNNAACTSSVLNYEKYSRICIPVPLYHCFGMVIGSISTITHGTTAVYPSRAFDAGAALDAVQQEKCTSLYGTPTMFIDMLNHPNFPSCDVSSLNTGIMAGSPCPIEVMKKVIDVFHMPEVTICYGLTETSPVTAQSMRDDPIDLRVSTVGRVHAHTEAKIIDSTHGRVVPIGDPGEICFRGYSVMMGYWEDEAKTKEAIDPNGWFHSGDLATMDENGYIYIIGRIKDVVIRGGENIYPTEIEQFLYKHPKIQDVQVIAVPDKRLGEEVCAWIKLHVGETATVDEIKSFCQGQIAYFKIPKYIKFVDGFPLTVTGKVRKFEMREEMVRELGL